MDGQINLLLLNVHHCRMLQIHKLNI